MDDALNNAQMDAVEDPGNPQELRMAAMDLLARREHLRRELEIKLGKRFAGAGKAAIAEVLDQLGSENLQSDQRFCESYVRQRASRGYGPERLRMEMRQKGADAELGEMALGACGIDWKNLARETRVKKFGDESPRDLKEKSRQLRFLQYRGFSGDAVASAFREEE